MDQAKIFSRIKQIASDKVLQQQKFGRSGELCLWTDASKLSGLAALLAGDHELRFDWLEGITAAQIDRAFLLTYFLRSRTKKHAVLVRLSLDAPEGGMHEGPACPSIKKVWAAGEAYEIEIEELFGIRFEKEKNSPPAEIQFKLNLNGFPLRKEFVFPQIKTEGEA